MNGTVASTEALVSDGVVRLRRSGPDDVAALIAGRDEVFHRWLGPGSDAPAPTACIEVKGTLVGWIDYDREPGHDWLQADEVNVGYHLFAVHRGRGYAVRSLQLLMHHLAMRTPVRVATLLIHPGNAASLAVAARARFVPCGTVNGSSYFRRTVPPVEYRVDDLTIRPQRAADLDRDLAARDVEQRRWMWTGEQRARWQAMTADERRAHALRYLEGSASAFGSGPKWTFAVDLTDAPCAGYVDCDLANVRVPAGEANISYAVHPDHRGRGVARRAVRCVLDFLRDHTGAREAHVIVDEENAASLSVARSLVEAPAERSRDDAGRTMLRHVIRLA